MDVLSVLFNQRSRKIGLIIPDVVVSEKHQDALEITEHPVEIGAPVSDHSYKRPAEVTMEIGFSGSGSLLDFADSSAIGISLGANPKEIYQQILDLQASRIPFDVTTGKRQYSNMLIRAIDVTTDRTSENVLMCVLTLREVIISQTESIFVADKADMQDGVSTSSVQNTGTKSVKTANTSLLLTLFDGAKGAFGL